MNAPTLPEPTETMRDVFLAGVDAHRALSLHLGPGEIAPDAGERLSVSTIVYTLRGGRRLRVSREPHGIAVRRLIG